jgi:hypothetical protein
MQPKDYKKEIHLSLDESNGYYYFTDKYHPLNHGQKVYFHRHLASVKLNRWIKKEEHVHHKDSNKKNNIMNNLEVMTKK